MNKAQAEILDRLLPLSAAETLFANRMIALCGCSAYRAAFEARQKSRLGLDMDLEAILRCISYNRFDRSERDARRCPIRRIDRVNIKRRAHGLPPLANMASAFAA